MASSIMKTATYNIAQAIRGTKFEGKTYIVGGYVRELVRQRGEPKDIDIVVELPNGGIELASLLYKKLNTTKPVIFKKFGTAQIYCKDYNVDIELVMTRKEAYDFKTRNPVVEFGTINDDVVRRDFTINSLLYDISSDKLLDLTNNGLKDLKDKIIRTTGNPDVIFMEDPLRIMRAIRFASQLGFQIEYNTADAMKKYRKSLEMISEERIRDEFCKILTSRFYGYGLDYLVELGILQYLIPEFTEMLKIKNQGKWHIKDAWNHTLEVISEIEPTLEHRLAALLHDVGKGTTMTEDEKGDIHFYGHQAVSALAARRFMRRYKFTNEQINKVFTAILMHMSFVDGMLDKTIRKKINQHGKELFLFCVDLAEADSKSKQRLTIVQNIRDFVYTDKIEEEIKLPINGNMVMEKYNLKPGPVIGKLLKAEKEALFDNPKLTIDELWVIIDKEVKNNYWDIELGYQNYDCVKEDN